MEPLYRLEKNVSGPFYTTGRCAACTVPEEQAPQLLAPLEGDNTETYFVRQPETPEEIECACLALEVCCVSDLRYGGRDRRIIERLGNHPELCDFLVDEKGELVEALVPEGGALRPELERVVERQRTARYNRFQAVVDGHRVTWRFSGLELGAPLAPDPAAWFRKRRRVLFWALGVIVAGGALWWFLTAT